VNLFLGNLLPKKFLKSSICNAYDGYSVKKNNNIYIEGGLGESKAEFARGSP